MMERIKNKGYTVKVFLSDQILINFEVNPPMFYVTPCRLVAFNEFPCLRESVDIPDHRISAAICNDYFGRFHGNRMRETGYIVKYLFPPHNPLTVSNLCIVPVLDPVPSRPESHKPKVITPPGHIVPAAPDLSHREFQCPRPIGHLRITCFILR